MPTKSKADLRGFPLRLADDERGTVEAVRGWFKENAGLSLSLNDVLRHLVRRAEIGIPRTSADGIRALQNHTAACEVCQPYQPPRCPDGIYMREQNRMLSERQGET